MNMFHVELQSWKLVTESVWQNKKPNAEAWKVDTAEVLQRSYTSVSDNTKVLL